MKKNNLFITRNNTHFWSVSVGFGLLGAVLVTGCSTVGLHETRLVSKPGMVFSESLTFQEGSRILPQLESGAAMSGGAQGAGCTSCR